MKEEKHLHLFYSLVLVYTGVNDGSSVVIGLCFRSSAKIVPDSELFFLDSKNLSSVFMFILLLI